MVDDNVEGGGGSGIQGQALIRGDVQDTVIAVDVPLMCRVVSVCHGSTFWATSSLPPGSSS